MKPVVVFDTGVLFSAIGWGGTPSKCLELARSGRIEGVTCTEILNELAEKLFLKLHFRDLQIIEVIGSLQLFLRPVVISGALRGDCADPKDDMVLECAVVGEATHIVSSDKRHLLSMKQFRDVAIISPAELVRVVADPKD